jgi:hypothetical protein
VRPPARSRFFFRRGSAVSRVAFLLTPFEPGAHYCAMCSRAVLQSFLRVLRPGGSGCVLFLLGSVPLTSTLRPSLTAVFLCLACTLYWTQHIATWVRRRKGQRVTADGTRRNRIMRANSDARQRGERKRPGHGIVLKSRSKRPRFTNSSPNTVVTSVKRLASLCCCIVACLAVATKQVGDF